MQHVAHLSSFFDTVCVQPPCALSAATSCVVTDAVRACTCLRSIGRGKRRSAAHAAHLTADVPQHALSGHVYTCVVVSIRLQSTALVSALTRLWPFSSAIRSEDNRPYVGSTVGSPPPPQGIVVDSSKLYSPGSGTGRRRSRWWLFSRRAGALGGSPVTRPTAEPRTLGFGLAAARWRYARHGHGAYGSRARFGRCSCAVATAADAGGAAGVCIAVGRTGIGW
jgi:hypothetical protein